MADNTKIYKIQDSQTGKIYEIEGPEGATDEELYSFLEQDLSANPPTVDTLATPKTGTTVIGQGTSETPKDARPLTAEPVQTVASLSLKDNPEAAAFAQSIWDSGVRDPKQFNDTINSKYPGYNVNLSDADIAAMRSRDAYYKARNKKNPGNFIFTQGTGVEDPQAPTNVGSAFVQAAERSLENMANSATGLAAVGADIIGADDIADELLQKYIEDTAKTQFNNPPAVPTFRDIGSLGDAAMYGADILGELLPQATSSMAGGFAGQLAGRKIAADIAGDATEEVAKRAGQRGLVAGTLLNTAGQETGSIYGDTYNETGVKAPVSSIIAGIAAGSLDAITPIRALSRLGVPAKEVTGRIAERFLKEGAKDAVIEGGTEAAQTFIEGLPKSVITGESPFTPEMLDNMAESFVRGAVGGAAMGGGSAVLTTPKAVTPEVDIDSVEHTNLRKYLDNQALPPQTGKMRQRNAEQKALRGQAVKEANDYVGNITKNWSNAPEFEVVPSWLGIKDKTLREGLDPNAIAAIVDGKMYINLKNIDSPADITAAVFHEGLGHHGLAQMFSNDLDSFLDNIYDNGNKTFRAKVDQWKVDNPDVYKDLDLPTQHRRAIEEVLAEMSENGAIPVTLKDKVSNFLKEWARKFNMNLKVSEREIRSILAMAHQNVMTGQRGNVALNGVRYMYAGTGSQMSNRGMDNLLSAIETDRRYPGAPTRQQLGWFKGPDGFWRTEIDDSRAAPRATDPEVVQKLSEDYDVPSWSIDSFSMTDMMDNMANEDFINTIGTKIVDLEDVLDHPALFAAYPELKSMNFTRSKTHNYRGSYDPSTKTIDVSVYNDNPLSTTLHEVQHAIQHIEGWSFGGSNAPYVLRHMETEKLVNGAVRYIQFLKGTEDQLKANVEEAKMIYEDPNVQKWWELKQEDQYYTDMRTTMRDDYHERGIDPTTDPEYRKLMALHDKAFREYRAFEAEFARLNGFDPKNLTPEQEQFIYAIKWDYVNKRDGGFSNIRRAEDALSELTRKVRDLEFITKEVDPRSKLNKTVPPMTARRDLERLLARDDYVLFEAYQHLMGEVEARDVQNRQAMNEQERLANDPYTSESHIDPDNFIFIDPRGKAAAEVIPISQRVKQIVDEEAEYWGITNIEKALTERDFRADVRARLAQMGLPQDSINLDPRIAKKIDPKYSMKKRVPRARDEQSEIAAAKDILDGILAGHIPLERSWAEAEADARRAGLTSKQIRSAKGVGELDKRLFMYEKVAQSLNEKLANLHAKMDNNGFSMKTKQKYLETLAEFNELSGVIFRDQGEIGRALNAIKALQFTKNKLNMLNDALSQLQGNGFKNFADDEAFKAFAERVQFMMNSDNPQGVAALAKSVLKPYWWQYVLSFRHSMMLSGLGTHAKNSTDNALMIVRELEEAAIGASGFVVRKGLQKAGYDVKDGVSPQEFAGRLYGLLRAGLDATTYKDTLEAFKTGRGNTVYSSKTEVADARIPVISHIQDSLHAADTFFRAFHNNTNLYAAGIRRARAEGSRGIAAFEDGSNYATTPDEALLKEAREMTDVALLVDRPSLWMNKLEGLKAIRPGMKPGEQTGAFIANLLFPFFRVTDRLLFQKIRRSPIGLLDRVNREDLAAGGARMDIALGRMAYGSLLLWYYWNQDDDDVTGAQLDDYDKQLALEAGGYMSNAVKKGNRYVDASALNLSLLPTDLQNSMATNIATIKRAYKEGASAEDTAESLKLSTLALLKVLSSQSFAENLSNYIEPAQAKNEASFDSAVGNVVGGFASSFVPAAMRQYNAMYRDPIKRDTVGDKSVTDRIVGRVKSGIPGLSDDLPAKKSVYGDDQPQGRTFLSMDNYRNIKTDPVSVELQRLERTTKSAVVVGAPASFEDGGNTYKLNAAERNEWNARQGGYLKDFVKELIVLPEWKTMSDAEKVEEIKAARKDAYEWAKEDMLPKLRPSND